MATRGTIMVYPEAHTISPEIFRDARPVIRAIDLLDGPDLALYLFVEDRSVLDALQAALDAIRADMDVEAAAELEAVAS